MMENSPLAQHGIEPRSSLNEDGFGYMWKNTKLTKKDSRSACDLRDHTDTTPLRVALICSRTLYKFLLQASTD